MEQHKESIGVFDSGYGGLTILKEIVRKLPEYNYVYLGDNARAPYGARSFEVVYEYTREAVHKLFEMGCRLVILACNTASALENRTTIFEKEFFKNCKPDLPDFCFVYRV